jgi:hypothetical protein
MSLIILFGPLYRNNELIRDIDNFWGEIQNDIERCGWEDDRWLGERI